MLKEQNKDSVVLIELSNVGYLLQYEKPFEVVNYITQYLGKSIIIDYFIFTPN
jgi:hypothetical protein